MKYWAKSDNPEEYEKLEHRNRYQRQIDKACDAFIADMKREGMEEEEAWATFVGEHKKKEEARDAFIEGLKEDIEADSF